ncbi:DnaJ homolog subfamily B member 11 [Fistulifera solaris]|uniref:DnaJ homolog subfamily B member 11 n=1 Tax=Fistulifera solaris TaxID=1519565 RepID=A0A1Z5KDI3_FISSO|nr:DnaJ homolog subfamily B member 11 [Fistulifera solaris]|eukprot:GAX24350.1 DnaJ homolog subfamily B member 11 [Fistulifera solaris]
MFPTRKTTKRGCGNSTAAASAWWKCLLLLTLVQVVSAADFYKLLGISRDATLKEIKKAYRQKSLEYHPDKNKEEGASERFAEINYAYEVLSDQEKRDIYNRHGEEGLKRHEQRGGGGGGGFDDIFEQMFNFGGGGRRRGNQEQTTPSVEIPLHLTLNELYSGKTLEVKYVRQVLCLQWEMCVKQAPECHGPGVRVIRQQLAPGFVQTVQQADEKCVAQGKMWNPNCKACPERTQSESIDLTIEVAAGLRVGERITFEGVTDERPGYKPGDLHFVIFEEPHADYHRDRDDLFKTMEIPLVDALTGFSITLTHLDGEQFTVDVNEVTDCDHVLRVHGKGMPRRNGRGFGDLYLTFEVDFPDELSAAQKEAIRAILGDGSSSGKNEEL